MRMSAVVSLLGALALGACASGATPGAMIAPPPVPPAQAAASPLAKAVAVEAVTGGEPTSPMWMSKVGNPEFAEALRGSLAAPGRAAAEPGAAKYDLRANLITLAQPMFGLDLTVKSSVKYTLVERSTKRTVYDDIVSADHTATFSDHPIAIERLRLSNEGSIRKNIEAFIRDAVARPSLNQQVGQRRGDRAEDGL